MTFALGTFSAPGARPFAGMIRDDRVLPLSELCVDLTGFDMLALFDDWSTNLPKLHTAAEQWSELHDRAVPLRALLVHAPLRPRQIFGIGANYRKHVLELLSADPEMPLSDATDGVTRRQAAERMMDERAGGAEPYCFVKLPTSVAGPRDPLTVPAGVRKLDWECELAVVMGRAARHVAKEHAMEYVAGYAVANDITARDLVFRQDVKALGTDWLSAKSQPGFTPLGPYVVPAEFVDPYALAIRLAVNGRVMQDEMTSDMLIRIDRQIAYLSSRVQLLPGDVVCTGSPAGNGTHHGVFLQSGDRLIGSITGLGEQRIDCVG
jgi:2,4-didehydro-3-deoxy-L-rhamnonate hydrolase